MPNVDFTGDTSDADSGQGLSNPTPQKQQGDELTSEVSALVDWFVLWTDSTPESNEPTELKPYLDSIEPGITDRLTSEIVEYIEANYTPNSLVEQKCLEAKVETVTVLKSLMLKHFTRWGGAQGNCVPEDTLDDHLEALQQQLNGGKSDNG